MTPKLSILISALESRRELRAVVEGSIRSQIAALGDPSAVELLIEEDNGKAASGTKRNTLIARSRGEYVAFVDDDDQVSDDYVSQLLAGIATGADVITFQLEYLRVHAGTRALWEFHLHSEDHKIMPTGMRSMTANHLCAWKRELAAAVPWMPIGYMDDCFWYRGLIATGLPKTEHHIPSVLYRYLYRQSLTRNQTSESRARTRRLARNGIDYYWRKLFDGRQVVIAVHDRLTNKRKKEIEVYVPGGAIELVHVSQLERFHEITLK